MRTCLYQPLIGRLGNQMFQYAYARSLSERTGLDLVTPRWAGERIFDLPYHQEGSNDNHITLPEHYHQDQDSLIYTRSQVKDWFRFRPEVLEKIQDIARYSVVCHRRAGDYADLGYVVVSEKSYLKAILKFKLHEYHDTWLGKEHEDYIMDFYKMMRAVYLFRGNSTFSWWAATLGDCKVFSPVIDGLEGGKEQDCDFVEGNWPKFANLPCCTDLHLRDDEPDYIPYEQTSMGREGGGGG